MRGARHIGRRRLRLGPQGAAGVAIEDLALQAWGCFREWWRPTQRSDVTGLVNFRDRPEVKPDVEAALRANRAAGRPAAVLYMDLDRFGALNKEHGQGQGDVALRLFAASLEEAADGRAVFM